MKKQILVFSLVALALFAMPQNAYAGDESTGVQNLASEQTHAVSGQWVEKNGYTYYQYSDGSYAKGWVIIEGTEYYFYSWGMLCKSDLSDDGYLVDENGHRVTTQGWCEITDIYDKPETYYIKDDGKAAVGWTTIDGKEYYFIRYDGALKRMGITNDGYLVDRNGAKVTGEGWHQLPDRHDYLAWYYIKADGKVAVGWNTINGKEYHFDTYSGKLETSRITSDGYFVDHDGAKIGVPGWHIATDPYGNNYWIYIKSDEKAAVGWNTINGKDYYFTAYIGRLETEQITNDGYLVGTDGAIVKGTWAKLWDSAYFYTDSEGRPYRNTWKWIDGKCYYFHEDGRMAANEYIDGNFVDGNGVWIENYVTGTWINDGQGFWFRYNTGGYPWSEFKVINGYTYYFDYYGYVVHGWQWIDGNYYYFEGFGEMVTGWKVIGNTWYYFNTDGKMQTGLLNNGYLMQSNGALAMNAWVWTNNNYYYGDSNGIPVKNGWRWINGFCYYFYEDGRMARNTTINGSYVDDSGAWVTDRWVYSSSTGKYWYRYVNGSYPYSTFKTIGGQTYYFDGSGYMATGWRWIGDSYYYFNSSGYMQTGWQVIGDIWYYFDSDGKMATGLQNIGGYQYYFADSGAMQTGWRYINEEWYYFVSGGWAPKGWQWINGKCYYFYNDGTMARNTYIEGSYVDDSGAWIP